MEKSFTPILQQEIKGHVLKLHLHPLEPELKIYIPYCHDRKINSDIRSLFNDVCSIMDGNSLTNEECMNRQKFIREYIEHQTDISCCPCCFYVMALNLKNEIVPVLRWNPINDSATLYHRADDKDPKKIVHVPLPRCLNGQLRQWLDVLGQSF